MIKTNIKMRVTPEQSVKVQEICFENGIDWKSKLKGKALTCINEPFIFVKVVKENKHLTWLAKGEESDFMEAKEEEIDPDLFIRTNGSCIEKEEFIYPMWFKHKDFGYIIKFDSLTSGEVVYGFGGWMFDFVKSDSLTPHTNITIWEQVENPSLATDKEMVQEESKETLSNMIKKNGGVGNPGNKREWIDFEDGNKAKNQKSKHYELWEGFEAIDVIKLVLTDEEYKGFLKGNILKYQLRLGKKDDVSKEIEKIEDYKRELKNEN